MRFNYNQWKCLNYIDEIRRQQKIYARRPDLACKNRIMQEIAEKNAKFDSNIIFANEFEEDDLIEQYQESVSELMIEYFNELSAMFQKMYTIFENQVALETPFDLSKYPKIYEIKEVVNVLKHNDGRAYKGLKALNSKFVQPSTEFKNIIPSMCSQIILNIEDSDLEEFCNEVEKAWMDRFHEYADTTTTENDSIFNA